MSEHTQTEAVPGLDLAQLEVQRRRLALDVREGGKAAQTELVRVENRIASIHRQAELDQLADAAQVERDEERKRKEEERERVRRQKEGRALQGERDDTLREIQALVAKLPALCQRAVKLDGQAGMLLEYPTHSDPVGTSIANHVLEKLGASDVLWPLLKPAPGSHKYKVLIEEKHDGNTQ